MSSVEDEKTISTLPTIKYYQSTYAGSLGNNDPKSIKVFKDYESHEKLNRLRQELLWIKEQRVLDTPLQTIVGLRRKAKYGSYEKWASLMLQWIVAAK